TELIESELFGHMKGSFTGAFADRAGKFELADGGTLFLDEVGDMSLSAQAKVLRALEEGVISRVGSGKTLAVDVRVVAATNKDLRAEIAAGRFREDLLYRLNVVPIEVPPLRARRADVPQLVEHFAARLTERGGLQALGFDPEALKRLAAHDWPGNIRELRNAAERLLILSTGPTVTMADVDRSAGGGRGDGGGGRGRAGVPAGGGVRGARWGGGGGGGGGGRAGGEAGGGRWRGCQGVNAGGGGRRGRLGRYLGACRARGTRRRRRRARGLALHARLRPPSHLLPRGRHDGDRRGSVVQHLVLEAAPRSGARRRTSADHLGNPAVYAGSVAPRRRQRGRRLALPRRVSAHAGAEALTPWHPTPDP